MFIKRLKTRYWIALGGVLLVLLLVVGITARRNYVQRFNEGELAYAYEVARSLGYTDAARLAVDDTGCGGPGFRRRCIHITFGTLLALADLTALLDQQGFDRFASKPSMFNLDRTLVDGQPAKNHILARPEISAWRWWLHNPPRDVRVSFLGLANDTTHTYTTDGKVVRGNIVGVFLETNRPYF